MAATSALTPLVPFYCITLGYVRRLFLSLTAPAPSRAIPGALGKFADMPREAEQEIRGLEQARRRIVELERENQELEERSRDTASG